MYTIVEKIFKHKKIVVTTFGILAIIFAIIGSKVPVNYNMVDYLPDDADSTVAINVMAEEYNVGTPNVRAMVPNLTIPQALEIKAEIEAVDGVESVIWLDDEASLKVPLSSLDEDLVDNYYKEGKALFTITVNEEKGNDAVYEIESIVGEEAALSGLQVGTTLMSENTNADIQKIMLITVPIILLILLLTTNSWVEPILFLTTIGVAIMLNMGTNIFFGDISFVTKGVASILQLAVSMDYAIFILHRYSENREQGMAIEEAMKKAVAQSFKSVGASGVTTMVGFAALILLRIKIGPDVGWVMVKAITISLICVFAFLPTITVMCSKWIDKTKHRSLLPSFEKFGKVVAKISVPALIIFVICVVPSYLAISNNDFIYFDIFNDEETQLGQDVLAINDEFGDSSTLVLMIEKGDFETEEKISKEIHELDNVVSVISYVDTVGAEVPMSYLSEDLLDQLISENYSRMVITLDTYMESEESFHAVEVIRELGETYYPDAYHLAGESTTTYDMKTLIEEDNTKVNLIAVAAIFVILMLSFRSISIPFILIIVIEGAIWINCGLPYFRDNSIYYIGYIVIGALQLGATVDYAILFTNRYIENRTKSLKKKALFDTIAQTAVSILTSGTILFVAGFFLSEISSISLLSQTGMLIGRGALVSLFAVLFVLPGLLMWLDKLIQKTTRNVTFINS